MTHELNFRVDLSLPPEHEGLLKSQDIFKDYKGSCTGVMIDIGACIGIITIQALQMGFPKIIAYEPSIKNFGFLQQNIEKFNGGDKISACNLAVTANTGDNVTLRMAGNTGQRSLLYQSRFTTSEKVMTISLEDALLAFNKIEYLKIDTEGSEFIMLSPINEYHEVLSKVNYIHVEFHPLADKKFYMSEEDYKKNESMSYYGEEDRMTRDIVSMLNTFGFTDMTIDQVLDSDHYAFSSRRTK